jgi:hypothetical protein
MQGVEERHADRGGWRKRDWREQECPERKNAAAKNREAGESGGAGFQVKWCKESQKYYFPGSNSEGRVNALQLKILRIFSI